MKPFAWIFLGILFTGCLGVQKKVYVFRLDQPIEHRKGGAVKAGNNQSGSATITYVNIFSIDDNQRDVTFKDFGELVSDYLDGDKLEKEMPGIRDVRKRLFVENNTLCGEIRFAFDSLSQVRLFRPAGGPILYFLNPGSNSNERLDSTNGSAGPDYMPIVFWDASATELRFVTTLSEDTTGRRNLVKMFRLWETSREP